MCVCVCACGWGRVGDLVLPRMTAPGTLCTGQARQTTREKNRRPKKKRASVYAPRQECLAGVNTIVIIVVVVVVVVVAVVVVVVVVVVVEVNSYDIPL